MAPEEILSEMIKFDYSQELSYEFEVQPAPHHDVEHGKLPPVKKLVELIDGHPDFFYVLDENQKFIYANKAILKLWGKSMEEVAGKGFSELDYPPQLQALHKKQLDLVFQDKIVRGENRFINNEGVEGYYEYVLVPLRRDKAVKAVGGITRDISFRKRLEDEKEYLQYAIAHDLRSPLSVILSSADYLLEDGHLSREQTEFVEMICRNGRTMEDLIMNLLESAKVRSGTKIELNLEEADLEEIVNWGLKDLRVVHGEKLIFKSGLKQKVLGLWDRVAIRRLLGNFVSNAAKYGDKEKPITVHLDSDAGEAVLAVHNHGVVVPESKLKAIKELLGDTGTVKRTFGTEKGWGIGLVVVRGIVESFEGSIEVLSDLERGTIFRVWLPIHKGH